MLTTHRDTTTWHLVSSPNPDSSDRLLAVAPVSSTYVWAVGKSNSAQQTLTERWDGTQWSAVSSPNPGSSANALSVVSVVPGTNVCAGGNTWAVGYYRSAGSPPQTLIEGYYIVPQCRP